MRLRSTAAAAAAVDLFGVALIYVGAYVAYRLAPRVGGRRA
jgi:hypothetical protein